MLSLTGRQWASGLGISMIVYIVVAGVLSFVFSLDQSIAQGVATFAAVVIGVKVLQRLSRK